jgi:dihydropteroate synthase
MGVLNVSPESFHTGSIYPDDDSLVQAALAMVEAGAALLDIGAMSTAPYLATAISADEESDRLGQAVTLLAGKVAVPLSADTARAGPARVALDSGARVINDVSGVADPALARLVTEREASLIAMANPVRAHGAGPPREDRPSTPAVAVRALLAASLERARTAGIPDDRIVLDPGIGFFRDTPVAWHRWDVEVLGRLGVLADLGRPLCVGVSRKSFIGAIVGRRDTKDRLAGSLAATAAAVLAGAAVIRAHDVAETVDAVRVAERIRQARDA